VTPRALVLRALGLGDVLTAVPALRAVRRGLPDHELVLAAPAGIGALVTGGGLVDRVLPTEGLGPLAWQGPAPEVAVDLHGSGPQSHRLLASLGPGRLVAYACAEVRVDGPAWVDDEHEVRRWCRLVADAGWPADPDELHLPPADVANPAPGVVVVHPGAAYPSRRWPAERFAAVADWLRTEGHDVVVTGSAEEVALAREVAEAAGLPGSCVLAGRTDLPALSALVAGAELVVCGDTGVAHLASAHRTPSVVVFGPVAPALWGPPAAGPHTVVWRGGTREARGGRGDPHGTELDAALVATDVADVIDAVRDRLQDTGAQDPTWGAATLRRW
jgi:ADP-heptose:LPS heptosyltransferase